jgi:hypothetical protein
MDGEDTRGVLLPFSECLNKKVLLCFFPAIAYRLAPPLSDEIAVNEVLTAQKDVQWRSGRDSGVSSFTVMAKAVVLLD